MMVLMVCVICGVVLCVCVMCVVLVMCVMMMMMWCGGVWVVCLNVWDVLRMCVLMMCVDVCEGGGKKMCEWLMCLNVDVEDGVCGCGGVEMVIVDDVWGVWMRGTGRVDEKEIVEIDDVWNWIGVDGGVCCGGGRCVFVRKFLIGSDVGGV